MPIALFDTDTPLRALREQILERIAAVRRARRVHPRPRGRGVRAGVRRLRRRPPRDRRRQRHRRDHDRAEGARRRSGRRGRGALVHLLRVGRGDRQRRRPPGVLRRRSGHPQRHARHGAGGADARARRRSSRSTCSAARRPRRSSASWAARAGGRRPGGGREPRRPPRRLARRRRPRSRSIRRRTSACFGDGGAITTDDDEVAELVRALRFHGSRDKQTFEYVGYNSRLDEIQAAILRVMLPELDGWSRSAGAPRREAYAEAGIERYVTPPAVPDGAEPAWHLYVATHPRADELIAGLRDHGVQARAYYRTPLHQQRAMAPYAPPAGLAAGHRRAGPDEPGAADEPDARRRAGRRGRGGARRGPRRRRPRQRSAPALDQVLVGNAPDHPRRHPHHHLALADVPGDERAGGDERLLADHHARHEHRAAAHPACAAERRAEQRSRAGGGPSCGRWWSARPARGTRRPRRPSPPVT